MIYNNFARTAEILARTGWYQCHAILQHRSDWLCIPSYSRSGLFRPAFSCIWNESGQWWKSNVSESVFGTLFESIQLLDPTVSHILLIVESDASHQGRSSRHPLYCEYFLSLGTTYNENQVMPQYVIMCSNNKNPVQVQPAMLGEGHIRIYGIL